MKKLKLFLAALLCMAATSFMGCEEGQIIPAPVCEYGQDICETLRFLCTLDASNKLDSTQVLQLQSELAQINSEVQKLKAETVANIK